MKNWFSPDSGFVKNMTRLCDLVLLNFLMDFCFLSVALSGAAIVSAYRVLLQAQKEETVSILPGFLKSIRQNIVAAFPATVLLFAACMLWGIVMRYLFAEVLLFHPLILLAIVVMGLLLTAVLSYLFPLVARYDNTFSNQLRNAAFLALKHPKNTILMLCVNLLPLLCCTAFPEKLHLFLGFWLLVGFSGSIQFLSASLYPILEALENAEGGDSQ